MEGINGIRYYLFRLSFILFLRPVSLEKLGVQTLETNVWTPKSMIIPIVYETLSVFYIPLNFNVFNTDPKKRELCYLLHY